MVYPEATLHGMDGFVRWYGGVIRIYFDEVHQVESVTFEKTDGKTADIKVVVRWQASRWNAPAPKSDRIILLAYQSWTVALSPSSEPRITNYTVDRLEYLPGSAQL